MATFDDLIGRRINGVFLGDDNWALVFRTTDGQYFRYNTENDCCNTVWINHMSGIDHCIGQGNSFDILRGALVTATEDRGWSDNRDDGNYDVIQDGFWSIITDRGYIDIEVRNSHNGYYGGSLVSCDNVNLDDIQDLRQVFEDF